MTSYHSVKNTAKNNKLIRAEEREIILCLALKYGLFHDEEMAKRIYPENMWNLRVPQFTYLKVPIKPDLDFHYYPHATTMATKIAILKRNAIKDDNGNWIIYDTKRLRIYRKRLEYGRDKKWRLNSTFQYLWTPLLLVFLMDGYISNEHRIYLSECCFWRIADNKTETYEYLKKYLKEVCDLTLIRSTEFGSLTYASLSVLNPYSTFLIEFPDQEVIEFPDRETEKIWVQKANQAYNDFYNKLETGGYLNNHIENKEQRNGKKSKRNSKSRTGKKSNVFRKEEGSSKNN